MFLAYIDLLKLFPKTLGVKDEFLFYSVSTDSQILQQKGLFIPLYDESGELKEAIQNGAIGAIWDEQKEIPKYVPNHFPILFTNNLKKAFENIIKMYVDKLNGEKNEPMNMTKFLFIEEKILNEDIHSYDKQLLKFVPKIERRG